MTRLTRADFENMTLGQLQELLDETGRLLQFDEVAGAGPCESACVIHENDLPRDEDHHAQVSSRGENDIDAMLRTLVLASDIGWFDSAQPFPAVAQTTPSDSIPVGSEGDSSNESKVS